jgi:hypothetical protein
MLSALFACLAALCRWLGGRKKAPQTDLFEESEEAHAIEDANRAHLPDGAAARRLREEWSRK